MLLLGQGVLKGVQEDIIGLQNLLAGPRIPDLIEGTCPLLLDRLRIQVIIIRRVVVLRLLLRLL
jgi:hypothetical protein